MFISIICPSYNSSAFVSKTVESILNQTYQKFEVIFSDDGSSDETVNILKKFKLLFRQKNISVKIIKNNHKGPGFARNEALKVASHDWIAFIDSDDLWTKDKLKEAVQEIKKNGSLNCVLHRQIYLKKNKKKKYFDFDKYYNPNKQVKNQLFKTNFFAMSTIVIKKKLIIDNGGFSELFQNAQDYDLWLRIGNGFRILIIKKYLGYYVERSGNITSRPYHQKIKNIFFILYKNRNDVNYFILLYRFIRIIFTLEWFKFIFK